MKMSTILYALFASMIFAAFANQLLAQQQGTVGVNIILKPIQTIQLGDDLYGHSHMQEPNNRFNNNQDRLVNVFGTVAYEVNVNRIAVLDSMNRSFGTRPIGTLFHKNQQVVESKPQGPVSGTNVSSSQTLIVYSIQVN